MKEKDINSLDHTTWRCQYHIVFAPKYRRMAIYGVFNAEIDEAARNRMELIVRSLAEQNGVTEQLKAKNQMEWVRQMERLQGTGRLHIVKIAVLGIAGVFLAIPLKREKGEYSTFVAMVVGICIFIYLLTKVETVLLFVDSIKSQLPVDSRYIGLVVKMVGITYVSEFAANLCRDSGYSAIAGQIEMFAKLSILVVSVPVFGAFLDAVGSFL